MAIYFLWQLRAGSVSQILQAQRAPEIACFSDMELTAGRKKINTLSEDIRGAEDRHTPASQICWNTGMPPGLQRLTSLEGKLTAPAQAGLQLLQNGEEGPGLEDSHWPACSGPRTPNQRGGRKQPLNCTCAHLRGDSMQRKTRHSDYAAAQQSQILQRSRKTCRASASRLWGLALEAENRSQLPNHTGLFLQKPNAQVPTTFFPDGL